MGSNRPTPEIGVKLEATVAGISNRGDATVVKYEGFVLFVDDLQLAADVGKTVAVKIVSISPKGNSGRAVVLE